MRLACSSVHHQMLLTHLSRPGPSFSCLLAASLPRPLIMSRMLDLLSLMMMSRTSHSHHHYLHFAVVISLSIYIMTSQCHITQLHRILQDYSLMSELPHSRLLSPVAGDRLPTAGLRSAEAQVERWAAQVLTGSWPECGVTLSRGSYQETFK